MKLLEIKALAASLALLACASCQSGNTPVNEIRPPATPLVMVDPFVSIWSMTDNVTDDVTRHFSDVEHPLLSAIRVDGETYRILGKSQSQLLPILPTINQQRWTAKYVMDKKPAGDWKSPDYNDSKWAEAPGAFGSLDNEMVATKWAGHNRDIWVRRTFDLKEDLTKEKVVVEYSHDDVFELYVNGIEVANTGNTWKNDIREDLPAEVTATLKPGKVTVAAHCHNTVGGAYVDFGLSKKIDDGIFEKAAVQKSLNVLPMRTIYTFECGGVEVELTFTAPMFMDDLNLMSRPVNYLSWKVRSIDGAEHEAQVYFETTPAICVSTKPIPVIVAKNSIPGVDFVKAGSSEQKMPDPKGFRERIEHGYYYIATAAGKGSIGITDYYDGKTTFSKEGVLKEGRTSIDSDNFIDDKVAMVYSYDFGKVSEKPVEDMILIAFDDVWSIQYFHENLKGYWARDGRSDINKEMQAAIKQYKSLSSKVAAFDAKLMADAEKAGGKKYADLCALAYRQCLAAHKLVEAKDGDLLWLSKENFSGGFINTVDVTYPSAPIFLYYNPELCKGLMNGIFHYSESGLWDKPFAAHDLGHYPCANGQHYGGNMPVEECGNMITLCAALAKVEGNADYSAKHWETLTTWVDYLVEHGQDPTNQLCTDDFAGHFAHNANLSIKAIDGIASYAMLAGMLKKKDVEEKYMAKAREMAAIWKQTAFDGDHYRLTFDREGTWSQKYNLVWDKLLKLNVFDEDIASTEIAYYLTRQNRYGLPLDSRKAYTKSDWVMWTATLASDKETFEAFIAPLWDYYNETDDRVPMSDWIWTDQMKHAGFKARSVVGGYYIKMLEEKLKTK